MFKNRNLTRTIAISTVLIALTAVTATAAIGIPGFSIFDTITTFFGGTSTVPERIGAPEPMTIGVCDTAGPIEVEASLVGPGPTAYATLGAAFTAINAGTHTGTISVEVCGNTTETGTAAVNASGSGSASYSFILIRPVGGVARTITGAVSGNPLVNLNGADNVTINGINSGGDTLTIQNTDSGNTSGTSTIKFIGGATGNTITNSTILGSGSMAVGTNGGVFWLSTDSVTTAGNDNNTISNNNIGPAGANLPSKGIYCNGSGTTTAIGNSGNIINNNNIFDYFAVATTSAGVYAADGCNTWSITNNRFYQTTAKAWTAGSASQHSPIWLIGTSTTSGSQGLTITGNIIGYASNTQTGTYAISGTGTSGRFVGIFFNGSVSEPPRRLVTILSPL
ncbi:MAG: hypothetical protein IPK98_15895 [Chloracidobacterium sp.]|nr:hypothetical protein [Chloracidobacterium sp.]